MSSNFKGDELNYDEVDKKEFVVFKAVKQFWPYLLESRTKVVVPYPAVRNTLVQKYLSDKRAPWMTSLQEYDMEIKPSLMVQGKGLCKLATESAHLPISNPHDNIYESFLKKRNLFLSSSTRFLLFWHESSSWNR